MEIIFTNLGGEMYRFIDNKLLNELTLKARESARKRSHHQLHSGFDDPVQRMVIGLSSGTYVRPHMHPQSNKWEMLLGIRGKTLLLIFDQQGVVEERVILSENNSVFGAEMKPGTWHTILPLENESVIMEIKQGPYNPSDVTEFAQWSPEEGSTGVAHFLLWAETAQINDQYN